ncbi:MAG: hypothetical protein ACJ72N_14805 [Labedaea sp.]
MGVRWRVMILAVATVALVTACGAGPDGNRVASLSSGSATPSGQQQASDGRSDEDKIRDFSKCMREHGVDVPEPTMAPKAGDGGNTGGPGIVIQGAGPEKEKIDTANEACRPLLPNGGQPPKLDAKQLDEMRRMAQCMREHGVNMPDPDPNKPGIAIDKNDGQDIDPEAMKKAAEACGGGELHTETRDDGGGGTSPRSGTSGGSK